MKIGRWKGFIDLAGFLMRYKNMMEFSFGKWGEDLGLDNFGGRGFKSVNVGETQISGVELSITGQGKINENLTINLLAGYTYVNPIPLNPDQVYESYQGTNILELYNNGEYLPPVEVSDVTYNNSSSDPSVLKYRYQHIVKIDSELTYKKYSLGSSFRFNDFMKNIDAIFTDRTINEGIGSGDNTIKLIPGINQARDEFKNGDLIIDSRIAYQLNDIFRFGFVINNLLNREYMSRPANMMPPRTFALQCNIKL